jgi:hypothetical protein
MKRNEYVLQWLDHTVHLSLNPLKDLPNLSESDLQLIKQRALSEPNNQIGFLHQNTLSLLNEKKIRVFINQYQQTLLFLLDQSYLNLKHIDASNLESIECCKSVISCIEKILEHVRIRFTRFINPDRPLSENQCIIIQKEFLAKIEILKARFKNAPDYESLTAIIWAVLHEFSTQSPLLIQHSQVVYFQGLISHLERTEVESDSQTLHHRLIHLLIGLNFNDRCFVDYYSQYVSTQIERAESGKASELLLLKKQFFQAYVSSDQSLYPQSPSLRKSIGNWFKQETTFLSQVESANVTMPEPEKPLVESNELLKAQKVMCLMSADQIGILLHSLDALRIVQAKSMSAVFESIVPSLSTMQKSDLSWKSMRSKSYVFEDTDRKAVTTVLQSMIKFIEEY